MSKLSANDRHASVAAVVVVFSGLVSVLDDWGAILVLAVLAAVGALGVVFAPRLAPAARLPGSKGSLLVIAGVVAVLSWIVSTVTWLDWIFGHLLDIYTLVFLFGLAGAALMAWTGWVALSAEGGKLRLGIPAAGSVADTDPVGADAGSTAPTSSAPAGPAAPDAPEPDSNREA
jgi:hypothetical protein